MQEEVGIRGTGEYGDFIIIEKWRGRGVARVVPCTAETADRINGRHARKILGHTGKWVLD